MRRWIFFLVLTLFYGAISQSMAAVNTQGPIKIAFVLATLQEERYQKDQAFFKKAAERLGFQTILLAADNNSQTQAAKVENALAQGVDAIVLQPVNGDTAANLVRLAQEDHVPVVAYDRLITNASVDFYVTQDSFQVGVLQAEAAVKATQGKGNYILLLGQAGHSVANEITRGVLSVLKKYPEIKIVSQKNHEGWSGALAMATVENSLTEYKNNIAAILANNSGMANGAVQALQEQKLSGKVFVAGADADLASIKNIMAGKQQFEVLKDIAPLAERSAEIAYQLAQARRAGKSGALKISGAYEVQSGNFRIPTLATPVYAISKTNLEEKIFKTGFHNRNAVLNTGKL